MSNSILVSTRKGLFTVKRGRGSWNVSDGDFIWVSRKTTNAVTKCNADTGAHVIGVYVGSEPSYLCFDGTYIWVSNTGSNDLTKIKAAPFSGARFLLTS